MAEQFLENRAKRLVELDDLAESRRGALEARYAELLNDPDQRDPDIMADAIGALLETLIVEMDNEEYAEFYIGLVADFLALSYEEICSEPIPDRGDLWGTGQALVRAVASRQASVEILSAEALSIGQDMGNINAQASGRMTHKQKQEASKDMRTKEHKEKIKQGRA
ncbi:MAG: hypothetical protein GY854_01835 [Deltaproteobacteria bacterium]|nr:hypothetical protein [Deltaproteobacteria bacterium]